MLGRSDIHQCSTLNLRCWPPWDDEIQLPRREVSPVCSLARKKAYPRPTDYRITRISAEAQFALYKNKWIGSSYTAKCPNSTWLERGKCRPVRARVGANLPRASGGSRGIAFPAPILLELTFDHFSTSLFVLPNLFPATQASKQLDFRTVGSNSSNSSPNSPLVISSLSPLPSHLFVARFSVKDPLSKSSTSI